MSGVSPVNFNGSDLYIPGAYTKRNTSSLNAGGATSSRLVLIGECRAGIPFNATTDYPNAESRINWVSNTSELNSILRDGPAYYGALFALTPSNQEGVNAPSKVGIIRINSAVQSSRTINDTESNPVLDIKSKDYGLYTNQIRLKISAGTTSGKKVSIKFEDNTITKDNILDNMFQMQYVGSGSACSITLDPVGDLVTTVTGGPGTEDLSIDLTTFDTVANLVAYINTLSGYSAVLTGDGTSLVSKLDKIISGDSINIKTAKYITATLQAVIDWINNSSVYLKASITASGTPVRRLPANDSDYVFLSGGSEGTTPVQSDYQTALDNILSVVDCSLIGALTSNSAIHSAISAHCTYMSGINGKNERQFVVGSALNDSKSTKIASAQAINNALGAFCADEIQRYDKNGNLLFWDGMYLACIFLGMVSGNPITFAPTNKMINCLDVQTLHSNPDKDDFIKAGCVIVSPAPLGGIRFVRSITTYQGSNKILNEFSAVRTMLFVTKDHRITIEQKVGDAGDATGIESIKNKALSRLDDYVELGYFVVDPAKGNAYRNVVFTEEADVIKITYEATLVMPINFILQDANFTVIGAK